MEMQALEDGVEMQALYTLSTLLDCATVLIHNSIDARTLRTNKDATDISIRIDYDELTIIVQDDGIGLPTLALIGEEQVCHPESKLYGFQGINLLLLAKVAKRLEISTKYGLFSSKKVISGRHVTIQDLTFSRKGTTVKAVGVFSNYNLRQKCIDAKKEEQMVKSFVRSIALTHPTIKLLLSNMKESLIVKSCKSSLHTFRQLFGSGRACDPNLISFRDSFSEISIDGFSTITPLKLQPVTAFYINHFLVDLDKAPQCFHSLRNSFVGNTHDYVLNMTIPTDIIDMRLPSLREAVLKFLNEHFKVDKKRACGAVVVERNIECKELKLKHLSGELVWQSDIYTPLKPMFPEKDKKVEEIQIKRDDLDGIVVIGQVDSKFIACRLDHYLLLIDQHAADERIKLEFYLSQFEGQVDQEREFHITVKIEDININWLAEWGLKCNATFEGIRVKLTRNYLDIRTDQLQTLITALIIYFQSKPQLLSAIPPPILNFFKSKACRNAIMFGYPLSLSECQKLLQLLSKCIFPFQCAHGRPSLVPILSISASKTR